MCSLLTKETHELQMSENKELRSIFGPKRYKINGNFEIITNE
jgi:hypothetical protein